MTELWDIVDNDRQHTGVRVERQLGLPDGQLHQVVHLCLIDMGGRMLIQRRVDTKSTWPGMWDVTVGGSVIAGETSAQGIAREVREELGLELEFTRPAFTFNFAYGFDDFYVVRADIDERTLAVPNAEVAEVAWASFADIQALKARGEFINYRDSALALVFDFVGEDGVRSDIFDGRPRP